MGKAARFFVCVAIGPTCDGSVAPSAKEELMKNLALVSSIIIGSAMLTSMAGTANADYFDNLEKIERLERDEARGGPWIEGGRSPFQTRYKVCNNLRTPVHVKDTSQRKMVMKKRCWFE